MTTRLEKSEVAKLVKSIQSSGENSAVAIEGHALLVKWRDEPGLTMDSDTRVLIEAAVGKK